MMAADATTLPGKVSAPMTRLPHTYISAAETSTQENKVAT